jgi:hypothetical protein
MAEEMSRRGFLAGSLAAAGVAAEEAKVAEAPEYYELRRYRLRRGPMVKRADEYFREALVPALRRHGSGPVGVFNVAVGPDSPTTYVLIPHPNLQSVGSLDAALAADEAYQRSGEPFVAAPPTDPAYLSVESTLLLAFDQVPRLLVPAEAAQGQPRLFELRTYYSHSHRAHRKKIEMFTSGGEIDIFKRVGLRPVLFSRTVVGQRPSITYMLVYADLASRERAWKAFGADPEWKKLSATPGYTDGEIVSSITNLLLTPAAWSQV